MRISTTTSEELWMLCTAVVRGISDTDGNGDGGTSGASDTHGCGSDGGGDADTGRDDRAGGDAHMDVPST